MSKRVWQHPEVPASEQGTEVWRSVGELEKTPQFRQWLEREFPEGSGELSEEDRELSRRNFVKLMGASSALAGMGLAACRRQESYLVPFKNAPEWVIPGKPLYYASTVPRAEGAVPVVVTTFEGRPTKLEPNRTHPDGGGVDARTQASVLDLYSPSRSRDFLRGNATASKAEFEVALAEVVKAPGKLAVVVGEDDCPTRSRLLAKLGKSFPGTKTYSYEPLVDGGQRAANAGAFGAAGAEVLPDFAKADRVLSFDCDFLGTDVQGSSKAFSERRQGGGADYKHEVEAGKMNRLYAVESAYTLTGGMADHRLRATPSEVVRYAVEVARALATLTGDSQLRRLTGTVDRMDFGEEAWKAKWVEACAKDLFDNKGKSLVLAGSRQSEGLHRLVIAMNSALQAYGNTATVVKTGKGGHGSIADLAKAIEGGQVDTLILLTPANPVFDAPADLKFGELLGKVKTSIHLGLRTDHTARACDWHIPAAHYLESWSDARSATGVYSLVQPQILPLFGGVSELELISQMITWKAADWSLVESGEAEAPVLLAGEGPEDTASPAHAEVKETLAGIAGAGDEAWRSALQAGFAKGTAYEAISVGDGVALDVSASAEALKKAAVMAAPAAGSIEVTFAADDSVWDGRYIDNAWLQEAPDPISKITWDNAAQVSPQTAKDLGIYDQVMKLQPKTDVPVLGTTENAPKRVGGEGRDATAPFIKITVGEQTLTIPVMIAFGHADNCITLPLGYGQAADDGREGVGAWVEEKPVTGLVGRNTGFNPYPLRTTATTLFATGAKVATTSKSYPVALTQEHHAMYGRALAREISTAEVDHKGDFEHQLAGVKTQGMDSHMPPNISLYKPQGSIWEKDQDKREDLLSDKIHQWGMAIDLNTCTGCNACLVACQAENAIPVVGKEQVARGREMHWIRMDRYFAAPKDGEKWQQDNPEMIPQPVACVQCESAPCETVCPVNATVHTEEGLNAMAYNRCIGTRYCANNCPYKARRFNYFDYNKRNPLVKKNLYKGPFGKKQVGEGPHLQRNPNVTVRMRGVMEKCTYCVQRLEGAKIKQKQVQKQKALAAGSSVAVEIKPEDLRVKTDSVRVACQDACDAGAITFGNLLDKKSTVVRAKGSTFLDVEGSLRNYDLLHYIGTRPRTSYLARVKNPNTNMPDAGYVGQATIHMH